MRSRVMRSVLVSAALLLAGCSLSLQDYVQGVERNAHLKYCQEIYTLLGKPSLTQELTDGSQLWTYSFKIPGSAAGRPVVFACDSEGRVLAYRYFNPPVRQTRQPL